MCALESPDNAIFIKRKLNWLHRNRYKGLKLVSKIRTSLRNGIDDQEIMSFIFSEFNDHVQHYLIEVSKWLLPNLPVDHPIRKIVEKQHADLQEKINGQPHCSTQNPFAPEEFANLLEENIRFEIRTLLPLLEIRMNQRLYEDQLNN